MDLYNRPVNTFVAGFIGSPRINFVTRPDTGSAPAPHRELWQLLAVDAPTAAQRVAIRPEHLGLVTQGPGVAATVELAEQLGDSAIIHLRVEGISELLVAKVSSAQGSLAAGQRVGLVPAAQGQAMAFDIDGQLLPHN